MVNSPFLIAFLFLTLIFGIENKLGYPPGWFLGLVIGGGFCVYIMNVFPIQFALWLASKIAG